MYKKILVTLENSPADKAILPHAAEFARRFGSELLLLHVADGWRARNFNQLGLRESSEMIEDREYLEKIAAELRREGFSVSTMLALGEPPLEILKAAESENCHLIAMAGHGHRLFGDIFHGSTITEVRHRTSIPILVIRTPKK